MPISSHRSRSSGAGGLWLVRQALTPIVFIISICRRKAPLHHFTTPDRFTLHTPREAVATYRFNHHVIDHHFCRNCGVAPFAEGQGPNGPMVEINLRCADGVDLDALNVQRYDGASR